MTNFNYLRRIVEVAMDVEVVCQDQKCDSRELFQVLKEADDIISASIAKMRRVEHTIKRGGFHGMYKLQGSKEFSVSVKGKHSQQFLGVGRCCVKTMAHPSNPYSTEKNCLLAFADVLKSSLPTLNYLVCRDADCNKYTLTIPVHEMEAKHDLLAKTCQILGFSPAWVEEFDVILVNYIHHE